MSPSEPESVTPAGPLSSLLAAVAYFSRLPLPFSSTGAAGLEGALPYLPFVGWITGILSALVYYLSSFLFPPSVAVALVLLASVLATGGFHEDGLADTADGMGGGWNREERLRIMKDSRTGSYGIMALILSFLLRYAALLALPSHLVAPLLVVVHSLSRIPPLWIVQFLPYARTDSSKAAPLLRSRKLSRLLWGSLLGLLPWLLSVWLFPSPLHPVTLAAPLFLTLVFGRYLWQKLEGYTGDTLGATQQMTEILLYLLALPRLQEWLWNSI